MRKCGFDLARVWVVASAAAVAVGAGCATRRDSPLSPDPALARRQAEPRSSVQPVDQSGPVVLNEAQPEAQPAPPPPANGGTGETKSAEGFSPTVEQAVRPVEEEGFQGAEPAVRPPAAARGPVSDPTSAPETTGGYQLVGTVLAEVNGTPIFADKVLGTVEKALAAQAKQLDERQFRTAAAEIIEKQVAEYVNDELEYAMAQRRLDPRDAELARLATIRWRDDQITQAGGSAALARQRVEAAGYDFEELAAERERWFMRKLYYEKREYPKIHVSASDLRRYYQEHQRTDFTTPDRARFRVIKVDKRKSGGRQEALGEINRLLDRARSGGKDFAELAAEDNDEESFKRPVEWFQRGAFAVKAVEDAVWQIEPGKVTDVIETPEAFYIAKLEVREPGGVKAFDIDVQRQIEATLKERQFASLRAKVHQALKDDAIIRHHPRMLELAVEMALQKYRFWRGNAQ